MQKATPVLKFARTASNTTARMNQTRGRRMGQNLPPHPLSHLHRAVGNQAGGRLLQAKLKVGQPGDKFEREADRVADTVMRMPEPQLQRQPEEEEEVRRQLEEEEETIQTKTTSTTPSVTPKLASNIRALRGRGQPLPSSVRSFFEPRFGLDFSGVRVHTGERAARTARGLNAKTMTDSESHSQSFFRGFY